MATTAAALGQHARAARLWGAAKAQREVTGAVWRLSERMVYEPARDGTRSWLEEAAWEAGFSEGKAMDLEEAVEYALSQKNPVTPASSEAGEPLADESPHSLTRREREVARLVAQGLTNRHIARELVISEHTVNNHVAHILRKLNLHSREQIASRLTQH